MANKAKPFTTQSILNSVYDATTGGLKIAGTINGNFTITGNLTVNGDFTFGDATTDILTVTGKIRNADGTAALPSYSFTSDTATGLMLIAAKHLGISANGATVGSFQATTNYTDSFFYTPRFLTPYTNSYPMSITGRIADGASAVGVILDNSTTLSTAGAKIVSFRNNTTEKAYIDKDGNISLGSGSASVPALNFAANPDTGIYYSSDTMGLLINGSAVVSITGSGLRASQYMNTANAHVSILGTAADGATSYATKIGSNTTLTTPGAKIAGFFNDGYTTEKAYIDKDGQLGTVANIGAANTGVTAKEYGDGRNHVTVLTVSKADAYTLADNASKAVGYLLYTLPAGACVVDYAYMSARILAASTEIKTDTPDVGLGTVIASGAVATLDGTPTFENIITGQTAADCNNTATVKTALPTAGTPFIVAAADAHTIYLNAADGWADDTGGDLTADIAGTVVLAWRFMA